MSTQLTCHTFSREIYKIWPESCSAHTRNLWIQSTTVLLIFYKRCLIALGFSTHCTWSLCRRCVSDSAVVDGCDPKLVGNSRRQSPNGVTPGLRVLDDAAIPDRWPDPLDLPLLWSVAAVPPSGSLWQPHVLQNEACQAASLFVLYLPLQVHLIPLLAVVLHTDQSCIGRRGVPWWREEKSKWK